ncbi:MAG: hypothetical protein M0R47_16580 [Methylobacter sp.]|uniref:hypothetical protein n=1 Tax=Methylobacter sp. TaxID=2051955 RepID=UPI0025DCE0F0|nr:hypothetical protein [Methylobacter sp.]MCK9622138.1 hypothetical protein [Methylobacter sp.]
MSNLVNEGGEYLHKAASVDVNAAVTANVDAAVAAQAGLRLVGYSAKESAAIPAAATFSIVHGATGAGGASLVHVNFAAAGSSTVWFGDDGIDAPNGLSIDWLTGQVDVNLFYKLVN